MLRFLQNSPHALELIYARAGKALWPFRRWLKSGTRAERDSADPEAVYESAPLSRTSVTS